MYMEGGLSIYLSMKEGSLFLLLALPTKAMILLWFRFHYGVYSSLRDFGP